MTVKVTRGAQLDLTDIWVYVAEQGAGTMTADAQSERLVRSFNTLAEHPELGRVYVRNPQLRVFSVNPFVIFYRRAEHVLEVVRVLHTARDISEDDLVGE